MIQTAGICALLEIEVLVRKIHKKICNKDILTFFFVFFASINKAWVLPF